MGENFAIEFLNFFNIVWAAIPLWYKALIHTVISVWLIGRFVGVTLKFKK